MDTWRESVAYGTVLPRTEQRGLRNDYVGAIVTGSFLLEQLCIN
jgi:hypothetical protein